MTDARFPERWLMDLRFHEVSADDFRAYSFALMWSVANRTDGVITPPRLGLIPTMRPDTPARLVAARLWVEVSDGWLINEFVITQTSRAQLEAAAEARKKSTERQRRHRQALDLEPAGQSDVTRDVTRGADRKSIRTRTRPRTGELLDHDEAEDSTQTDSAPRPAQKPAFPMYECQECGRSTSASLVPKGSLLVCRSCRFAQAS